MVFVCHEPTTERFSGAEGNEALLPASSVLLLPPLSSLLESPHPKEAPVRLIAKVAASNKTNDIENRRFIDSSAVDNPQ
ncbi:hypothetical protein KKA47_02155 [bacterium]|nr:hypothetical protein [bacterium]